jgi:hypothetical protein
VHPESFRDASLVSAGKVSIEGIGSQPRNGEALMEQSGIIRYVSYQTFGNNAKRHSSIFKNNHKNLNLVVLLGNFVHRFK